MIAQLIHNFSVYCITYPELSIESVFNRYMQLLTSEEIEEIIPLSSLLIEAGEQSRLAFPEVQDLIKRS